MPTFNSAKYISQAVTSILNQSFFEFELFIIDDGSTDNTTQIINGYRDKRIRYIKREHQGFIASLNYGIKNSSTDLIARMDADDMSHVERLKYQYEFISHYSEFDVIGSNIYIVNSANKILYGISYPEEDLQIKKNLLFNSVIPHAAVLMRRNVFERVGYFDEKKGSVEDYDFWLRAINKVKFYNIQEYLYYYRRHSDSSTGSLKEFRAGRIKTYHMMEDYLLSKERPEAIPEEEIKKLNTKFLVRYSPHFEAMKILRNKSLLIYEKIYYLMLSAIPFRLKCLYFFFNPRLRIKYLISGKSKKLYQ